ncbi:MAG: hypothetical protein ACOYIK_02175 [Coriobacteriales bacterium]
MTRKFFPGCKVKAAYPEASKWLEEKVMEYGWADEVVGCCRINEHQHLGAGDTAVCICNNCTSMLTEDTDVDGIENIWVLMDSEPDFPLPDYSGRKMAIQDCARAYDRANVQDAVRSLIEKMGIEVVELPDAREKTIFCGPNGMREIPKQDGGFAPKRYLEELPARGAFVAHDEAEIEPAMVEHFKDCPVDDVVTYCIACDAGVKMGKKNSVPLLNLVAGLV